MTLQDLQTAISEDPDLRKTERGFADLAILTLRDNGVPDAEILRDYTEPSPRADAAIEAWYLAEGGRHISMLRVKAKMKRLLTH